ncbi:MAG: nitrate- and nitrite sensing domain-containing protein, partial [Caldimonas sp.]
MNSSQAKTSSLLHRLGLAQKFVILGTVALVMTALPTALFLKQSVADIHTAKLELRGTSPAEAVLHVVQATQAHRGLSNGMLSGEEALAAKRPAARAAVGKALDALQASLANVEAPAPLAARLVDYKKRWVELEQAVSARSVSPAESLAQHSQLIADYLALDTDLLDEFGLSLDPQADTYAMIMSTYSNAPMLAERLAQMRGTGTGYLAAGKMPPDGRVSLFALQGRSRELFSDLSRNLAKATVANAAIKSDLGGKAEGLKSQIDKTLAMVDTSLLKAADLKLPARDYFQTFTSTVDSVYAFNAQAHETLVHMLEQRVQDLQRAQVLTLGALLALLAGTSGLAIACVRSITQPIGEALTIANGVAAGKLDLVVPVRGTNEIGQLMQALSMMQGDLLERTQRESVIASENLRIRNALDKCTTNVMVADDANNIIYMNETVAAMMLGNETELKKSLPQFDARRLIGQNIDVFHKNPVHQRSMLSALTKTHRAEIKVGELTFGLIANPIIDDKGVRIGTVVEWADRTAAIATERRIAEQTTRALRAQSALEAVTSNVMIADADNNVVFMNKAVEGMLSTAEGDLRKVLPNFETRRVVGSNIDIFHKNPAHQKHMLAAMRETFRTQITVGARIFGLVATPIVDAKGERAGTVVEWADRTAEIAVEKEVDAIVQAASAGDFSTRLMTEGKEGFFKSLSLGVNQLLETSEQGLNDVAGLLAAFAEGDLTHRIERDYQGLFGKVKDNGNQTAEQLTRVLGEVRAAADALTGAANQVSATAQSLSQSASEQASSVEETTASIDTMSASITQNSD